VEDGGRRGLCCSPQSKHAGTGRCWVIRGSGVLGDSRVFLGLHFFRVLGACCSTPSAEVDKEGKRVGERKK